MPVKRIIVFVTNDLETDQRVHRTCTALSEAGWDVTLWGRRMRDSKPLTRPYRTHRMRLLTHRGPLFYAEYNLCLFFRLLFSRADLFYANDTDTLLAAFLAARLRRKSMVFDSHELFPEVPELIGRERVARFWRKLEDRIIPRIKRSPKMQAVTVSHSFADIFHERYGITMSVVRNVPSASAAPSPEAEAQAQELLSRLPADKKILLYQGAVNLGRGVEWVLDAMPFLPDCHYVVAGVGDLYGQLRHRAASSPASDRITFLGRLQPEVLRALTPAAHIGLALLENRGRSYCYTLPNRIADFIHAGVPLLATDFPEVRRIVTTYNVGTLVPPQPFDAATLTSEPPEPQQLAQQIHDAIAYWEALPEAEKAARFAAAAADLSWQNDKKVLIDTVQTII
ncbi:MAG: glycosyltransferase family 4 protein [Bacteroidales bacterium]|nr:glycosyltransferase family 4 protein [Bacteroidales bacterium]